MDTRTTANVEEFIAALYPSDTPLGTTLTIVGSAPTLRSCLSLLPVKSLQERVCFITLTNQSLVFTPKTAFRDPEKARRVPPGRRHVWLVKTHCVTRSDKWSWIQLRFRGAENPVRFNVVDSDLTVTDQIVHAVLNR